MAYNWNWDAFSCSPRRPAETTPILAGCSTGLKWTIYPVAVGLGDRAADRRLHHRGPAHRSEPMAVRLRDGLRRSVPQHSAAGAALHLVFRHAGTAAPKQSATLQADQPDPGSSFLRFDGLSRPVYRARVAEQVRSGINSLPPGQKNAGLAMGFTLAQTYRYVMLPMAYRIIMPPLTSEFLNIFKNSAVCHDHRPASNSPLRVSNWWTTRRSPTRRSLRSPCLRADQRRRHVLMRWVEENVRVPGYIGGK
jgi:hypothetical protein